MKKILALSIAFIAALSLMSCNDDNEREPVFRVRPGVLTFDKDAGEPQVIDVITSSDVSWKAEVVAVARDWLTITTEADKVIVSAAENTTDEQRTGKIIISSNNDNLSAVEVDILQNTANIISITATKALLQFWGDYFQCGLSNYYFVLGSGDAEYLEYDGYIDISDGYIIDFDLFTEEFSPEDYQNVDLKEGTYKSTADPNSIDFEFEKMSFLPTILTETPGLTYYEGSVIMKYENRMIVERYLIRSGEFTVKNDNGNYTIAANLSTTAGEIILINYSGQFDAKLQSGIYSTYEDNLDLSGLGTGKIEFYGELADNPELYHWYIMIDTPGYDNVSNLHLSFYSPMTSPTAMDSGPYIISGVYPYETFTAEAGYVSSFYMLGCWVVGYVDEILMNYAPLVSGTIDLTYNGGDNYTIKVDALMDNYYAVKASFEGDLEYTDMTVEPQPMPPLKMSPAKALRNAGIKKKITIDKINSYK